MAAPDPVDVRLLALVAELGKAAVHEIGARLGMDPREVAARLVALSATGLPLIVGVECDPNGLRTAIAGAEAWLNYNAQQGAPAYPGPAGAYPAGSPSAAYPANGPAGPPSGAYPVNGPAGTPSGAYPVNGPAGHPGPQGTPSGAYPVNQPGPPSGGHPAGTQSGPYPTGAPGTQSGAYPVGPAGTPSGAYPVGPQGGPSGPSGPYPPPGGYPQAGQRAVQPGAAYPARAGAPVRTGPPSAPFPAVGAPGADPFGTWGPPQSASWARGDQPVRGAAAPAATAPAAGRQGRVGDTLQTEGLDGEQIAIQLVEVVDPADFLFTAAGYRLREGERAVVVHTEMTNRGAIPFPTLPDLYLVLVDADGKAVGKAPVSLSSRPPHRIGVPPGETAGGHTVYVLPDTTEITSVRWSARSDDDKHVVTWTVDD
ncbi:MAG TPA: AsnC family protein [Pseudonocardiaceae bacterium]|nr:AsnC family protein [Pseudonocardiaceae bacterium]